MLNVLTLVLLVFQAVATVGYFGLQQWGLMSVSSAGTAVCVYMLWRDLHTLLRKAQELAEAQKQLKVLREIADLLEAQGL